MTKDEALKLALAVLKEWRKGFPDDWTDFDTEAITAIREALAQPEQEPVAWMYQDKSTHEVRFQKHMKDFVDHSKTSEVPLYSEPLANHELQCVCGAVWCGDEMVHLPNKKLHRKPLSDEEFISMLDSDGIRVDPELAFTIKELVEAAHGIKE